MGNKYHVLNCITRSDPDGSLLDVILKENGYPGIACHNYAGSQEDNWFIFMGNKDTDLERDFADYLLVDPPDYFKGKTINLTLREAFDLVRTTNEGDEKLGWRDPRKGAISG